MKRWLAGPRISHTWAGAEPISFSHLGKLSPSRLLSDEMVESMIRPA